MIGNDRQCLRSARQEGNSRSFQQPRETPSQQNEVDVYNPTSKHFHWEREEHGFALSGPVSVSFSSLNKDHITRLGV